MARNARYSGAQLPCTKGPGVRESGNCGVGGGVWVAVAQQCRQSATAEPKTWIRPFARFREQAELWRGHVVRRIT